MTALPRHKLTADDFLAWADAPNPLIVVEILSPSTAKRDRGVKRDAYFSLPSVHHDLIVDPDRGDVTLRSRTADGIVTRHVAETVLRLDPPGLDVDLTEVRAG